MARTFCLMMMMTMMHLMMATIHHSTTPTFGILAYAFSCTTTTTRRFSSKRHFVSSPLPPLIQQQRRRVVLVHHDHHQGDDECSDADAFSLEDHVDDDAKIYSNDNDDDDNDNDVNPVASVAALNALVPRSKITPLIQSKSNLQGSMQVAFHLGMLALAAAAAAVVPTTTLLPTMIAFSILAMAFVSSFFFHALHEMVHGTAFSSRWANVVFSHIFGFLCLRPARHYYYYHWQHHRYTGNVQLDSELALSSSSLLDFPVNNIAGYLLYLSGLPFWVDAVLNNLIRHAAGKCPEMYLSTDKARRQVTVEARVYLALYALVGAIAATFEKTRSQIVQYWILPALLGQPFLRFYLLAEHRGRKTSPLVYENTRTMQNTPWLYRKLAWNMPFHMEHHAWPSIPFHQLRHAHELLTQAAAAAAAASGAANANAENTKTTTSLVDQGEVHADFVGCGNKGYIAFNWKFVKRLFQQEKSCF